MNEFEKRKKIFIYEHGTYAEPPHFGSLMVFNHFFPCMEYISHTKNDLRVSHYMLQILSTISQIEHFRK